jgi:hypothetical protein
MEENGTEPTWGTIFMKLTRSLLVTAVVGIAVSYTVSLLLGSETEHP